MLGFIGLCILGFVMFGVFVNCYFEYLDKINI